MPSTDYTLKEKDSSHYLFQSPLSDQHIEIAKTKTTSLGAKIFHYTAGGLGKVPGLCIPIALVEMLFLELTRTLLKYTQPLAEKESIKEVYSNSNRSSVSNPDSDIEKSGSAHSSGADIQTDENSHFSTSDQPPPANDIYLLANAIIDVDSLSKEKKLKIKKNLSTHFNATPQKPRVIEENLKFTQIRRGKPSVKTTKLFHDEPIKNAGYESAASYAQGIRTSMEDEHDAVELTIEGKSVPLFMVLDGHSQDGISGKKIAKKVKNLLPHYVKEAIQKAREGNSLKYCLKAAFNSLNEELRVEDKNKKNWDFGGTTAVTAFIIDDRLCVANTGDSRAVGYINGKTVEISQDAKPEDPLFAKTILKNGGTISDDLRVEGVLGTARAFGDFGLESLTSTPKIYDNIELSNNPDDFLILACDGIWDVLESHEATEIVKNLLDEGNTPAEAAKELITRALNGGSGDNCTAMIVRLFSESK